MMRRNHTRPTALGAVLCFGLAWLIGSGPACAQGTGGPDAFGYQFIDSSAAGGPALSFEDITGTPGVTTLIPAGSPLDTNSAVTALPFSFTFYGVAKASFVACNKGYVVFTDTPVVFTPTTLPTASAPNDMIAAFWESLVNFAPDEAVLFNTLGVAPNRRAIIQYRAVTFFGVLPPPFLSFQIKLFEGTNNIEIHYANMFNDADGVPQTIGIENATGTVGLQYRSSTTSATAPTALTGTAVRFFIPPPVVPAGPVVAPPKHRNARLKGCYVAALAGHGPAVAVASFVLLALGCLLRSRRRSSDRSPARRVVVPGILFGIVLATGGSMLMRSGASAPEAAVAGQAHAGAARSSPAEAVAAEVVASDRIAATGTAHDVTTGGPRSASFASLSSPQAAHPDVAAPADRDAQDARASFTPAATDAAGNELAAAALAAPQLRSTAHREAYAVRLAELLAFYRERLRLNEDQSCAFHRVIDGAHEAYFHWLENPPQDGHAADVEAAVHDQLAGFGADLRALLTAEQKAIWDREMPPVGPAG